MMNRAEACQADIEVWARLIPLFLLRNRILEIKGSFITLVNIKIM